MEPLNNLSVKADPVNPLVENEQLSKLPDCVPLEIKSESDLPPLHVPGAIMQDDKTDLSPSSEPCSLGTDLQGAGSGACAAGEAAGALPRCEGHGHRTGRAGPPVLPGGPLPDAADLGRERRPRRRTSALLYSAGVADRTAQNAPGERGRRNRNKLRVSVTAQSYNHKLNIQVSAWWWALSLRSVPAKSVVCIGFLRAQLRMVAAAAAQRRNSVLISQYGKNSLEFSGGKTEEELAALTFILYHLRATFFLIRTTRGQ